MESYFFIIIVVMVLKILFWTFYFYVRAQRARQLNNPQRVIIVGPREAARIRQNIYNDRSAIINHAESISTGPPPYAEVVKDYSASCPPTYDQAMAGSTSSAQPVPSNDMTPQAGAHSSAMASPTPVCRDAVYSGPVPSNGNSSSQQFAQHLSYAPSSSSSAMQNMPPAAATQPHPSAPVSYSLFAGQNPSSTVQ